MRGRNTLFFFAGLAALAALVYVFEIRGKTSRDKAEARAKSLVAFVEDSIRTVTVFRAADTLRFERDGDAWRLLAPVSAAGDRYAVRTLVSEIASAKTERTIEGGAWSDYGLAAPRYTVVAGNRAGSLDTLMVGDANPTGSFLYARKSGKNEVLLAGTSLAASLGKTVFELRDKSVLAFEKEEVRGVEIRTGSGRLALEKKNDAWELLTPVSAAASKSAVDDLLNKFKWAEAKAFVDESPRSLSAYGLDPPVQSLALTLGPAGFRKTLLLGRVREGRVFARDDSRPAVFSVDTSLASALRRRPEDLRDRKLCAFDEWNVSGAEFRAAGKTPLVCRKDTAGAWFLDSPKSGKAKGWKITGLFSSLSGAEAVSFAGKPAGGLGRYGLETPSLEVVLRDRDGKALADVAFGAPAGRDAVYALNRGTGWLVTVRASLVNDLSPSAEDMLETPPEPPADAKKKT